MSEEQITNGEDSTPLALQKTQEKFGDSLLEEIQDKGELTLVVHKDTAYALLEFLKTDPDLAFAMLIDVTAVDYSEMEDILEKYEYSRFMVVYQLYSLQTKSRLRVKVSVHEKELKVQSVAPLWKSADWLERETYDMFGITFEGHPNLKRILMPDDFGFHPLRKDYPLHGRGEREAFNFDRDNL